MRGRTRPYEERDTSLRREGRVPKIHVRIWQNPQEDFIKSTAGFGQILCRIWANPLQDFSGFCKWLENKAIEKRKNFCKEVEEVLCRSLRTSLQKFGNLTGVELKLDLRRPVG